MTDGLATAWVVYLFASAVFLGLLWRLTRSRQPSLPLYLLRAFFLALIYTPWYANSSGESYAPALMVATLDLITIDSETALRSLMPLLVSLAVALLAAIFLYLLKSKAFQKQ
jgi:hypothetical protein